MPDGRTGVHGAPRDGGPILTERAVKIRRAAIACATAVLVLAPAGARAACSTAALAGSWTLLPTATEVDTDAGDTVGRYTECTVRIAANGTGPVGCTTYTDGAKTRTSSGTVALALSAGCVVSGTMKVTDGGATASFAVKGRAGDLVADKPTTMIGNFPKQTAFTAYRN